MKGFNILLVFLFGFISCFAQKDSNTILSKETDYGVYYGEEFALDAVDQQKEVWQKYTSMSISDSLNVQFKTKVKEVCKVKGCWMVVELPEGEQAMVRFKDYGFFMPFDIPEREVVLNGMAFVEEMSVEDQKHYAIDAGKSTDEIAKMVTPKRTFSFEASGVLVPN